MVGQPHAVHAAAVVVVERQHLGQLGLAGLVVERRDVAREATRSTIDSRLTSCQKWNFFSSTKPNRSLQTSARPGVGGLLQLRLVVEDPPQLAHPRDPLVAVVPDQRPAWPPGRSTRAISGSARSWSNQWKACAATTTSTERSGSGISSAPALAGRDVGQCAAQDREHRRRRGRWRARRGRARPARAVSLPVPAPSSRTVAGSRPTSQAAASAGNAGPPAVVGLGHRAEGACVSAYRRRPSRAGYLLGGVGRWLA